MNMGVQISIWDPAFNYLGNMARSGIARNMVILFLIFQGTIIQFFKEPVPLHIPTNGTQAFQCLHIFTNICYYLLFDSR